MVSCLSTTYVLLSDFHSIFDCALFDFQIKIQDSKAKFDLKGQKNHNSEFHYQCGIRNEMIYYINFCLKSSLHCTFVILE